MDKKIEPTVSSELTFQDKKLSMLHVFKFFNGK